MQKKAANFYDVPARKLVAKLQAEVRKADFVRLMRKEGVGPVGAKGDQEAAAFWGA